jgi:hypothetical protein
VFSNARGKSLTFDLAQSENQRFHFFGNGLVATVEAAGAGRVRLNDILNTRDMEILTPHTLVPERIQVIRSLPTQDRVFVLDDLQNVGAMPLKFGPTQNGASLQVEGAPQLGFDLEVSGLVGQGMQEVEFANVALGGQNRALLQPQNWGSLQTTGLRLQLQDLRTNQVQSKIVPRVQR